MPSWLADVPITSGAVPVVLYVLALAAVTASIVIGVRAGRWRRVVIAGVAGGVFGGIVAWLVGDVWNLLDVGFTVVVRFWIVAAFAALAAVGAASLGRGAGPRRAPLRRWRIATPAIAAVLAVAAAAIGIDTDFGQYPTIGEAFGVSGFTRAALPAVRAVPGTTAVTLRGWRAPAGMPRSGRVSVVDIPGTVSHFHARPALVYLPPAALTAAPPPLPVLIALSGQPGQPSSVFRAGHLDALMNAYAATHHGLAPIVVAPDQLGSPYVNPMCVDGRLGNSRSYLTIDVPRWIRAHLSVLSGRRAWAIGGFSQGGTCSVQLAAGDPALFGSFVDVAGELVPSLGTVTKTIDGGFSRNAAAYRAATPRGLMLARAPYADTVAFFTVGQTDTLYTHRDRIVARIARSVGMHVTFLVSPGTGHDWSTVDYGFVHALPVLTARMGLP